MFKIKAIFNLICYRDFYFALNEPAPLFLFVRCGGINKIKQRLTPVCHSERSAEDGLKPSRMTMFLHAVELFLSGFSAKKARAFASGILKRLRRAYLPNKK